MSVIPDIVSDEVLTIVIQDLKYKLKRGTKTELAAALEAQLDKIVTEFKLDTHPPTFDRPEHLEL